jgi:hypothetical protein
MGPVLTERERIRLLEAEKAELQAKLRKANATLEYVAMMADVDIDDEEEAGNE